MQTPREIIAHWSAKLQAQPERFQGIGGTFKFSVAGVGGGTWLIACKPPVAVTEGDGPADCIIDIDSADFVALANHELNPQVAYLSGKIRVSGNISLALSLGDFI